MLNPEAEAAYFIARNLEFPNALNVETFAGNKVNLVEVLVEKDTYLDGIKLVEFKNKYFASILVCIVKRGQEVYIPTGNFILQAGDRIYVTGIQSELSKFYKSLGHKEERIKICCYNWWWAYYLLLNRDTFRKNDGCKNN